MNSKQTKIYPNCEFNSFFLVLLSSFLGGDDGEDYEDGEEPKPSCGDYIMHFLTLFWKLIFAFIPPTGKLWINFS